MSNDPKQHIPSAADIVDEMERRGLTRPRNEMGLMAKMGIVTGGFAASTCYAIDAIPVLGHAKRGMQDFGAAYKVGWDARCAQIAAKEQIARQMAEQMMQGMQPAAS